MLQRIMIAQGLCRALVRKLDATQLPVHHCHSASANAWLLRQYSSGDAQHFILQQPPYRLAVMSPHASTAVTVVSGDFESIQVSTSCF